MVMKLIAFLLMIAFVQVSAKGYGQVTLHEKNAPFEKVMASIRKQTSYTIFYNEQIKTGTITIDLDNAGIKETLDKLFLNLPITYKIIGSSIFLKEKESELLPNIKTTEKATVLSTTVSGTILNEDKRPFEGVSVLIKGTANGTRTNANGYFRLDNVEDNDVLRVRSVGYIPVEINIRKFKGGYMAVAVQKEQAENLKSENGINIKFTLHLTTAVGELTGISVKADLDGTKQIGTVVDLKHRSHLNLGQVLEGSVPGLTLKSSTTNKREISISGEVAFNLFGVREPVVGIDRIRELYNNSTVRDFHNQYPTFESFYNWLYSAANNRVVSDVTNKNSTTNSGLIPELRGSSSFTGNTSGMLVVIDGVEQSGFPDNYPMNNVVKIEVIKDPVELVKWGPKATGGLILITTNGAKSGKLQFNYNSNFSYSAKPDISSTKLRLASSADILDYYQEQVDKGLARYIRGRNSFTSPPVGLKPAELLLYNLKKNKLPYTDAQFQSSWDSLARLSNRDQLRNLYQNVFSQNHSLNITGGIPIWGFSLGGIYNNSPSSAVGSKTTGAQLNLQNKFNLLKNKLAITWQLNIINTNEQSSLSDNGNSLDPYQMLLTPQNEYVYDYSVGNSEDLSRAMQQMGYENEGTNLLENALNTKTRKKTGAVNSLLNINWNLSKSLQWSTAFVYNRTSIDNRNVQGAATSQVRQLRNNYGSPDSTGGVIMYVPPGDILNTDHTKSMDWNLRSGLSYNHSIDEHNVLTGAFGIAATNSQGNNIPNATIYGYGPNRPTGTPLLTFPEGGIRNYIGTLQYPSSLQAIRFSTAYYDRSFSLNGNLGYTYDNRYKLRMQYGSIYTPNAGFTPSFSGTKNYEASASWMASKEAFFNVPLISTLTLSAVVSKIQLGKSPDQITSSTIDQPLWNNSALIASGYTPSQLNGQRINNIGGGLQMGLLQERINLQASYNHASDGSHQINGQVAYQIYREPWFNVPFISMLVIDASLQNFNSLQAQAIVMGTNTPNANGGFSMANNLNFGLLPPATVNKEAHVELGLFQDRLIFDTRYYHKTISSTSGSGLLPPDPSTGVASQLSYSRMLNKGVEFYLKGKVVQRSIFSYTITINGAYNTNMALDIPNIPFSQYATYLTAYRTGYATDALWSYRWAGLDNMGNPQVYKDVDTKVPVVSEFNATTPISTTLEASSLVYSGRTTPPWSGGLIQEWTYKSFFASARLIFNMGHIMRTYIPVISSRLDKNILIGQRWKNPGDEAHTDIAAMAQANPTRDLVIQNSTNSIVSADHIRLREVQFGYEVPANILKMRYIKALTISAQAQNLALWARNKQGLDPVTVGNNGMVGIQQPRQYMLTINASF